MTQPAHSTFETVRACIADSLAVPISEVEPHSRLLADLGAASLDFVDIVFMLLAPEGAGADHLKALSRIARVLRDQDLVTRLRSSDSVPALDAVLNQEQASNAA